LAKLKGGKEGGGGERAGEGERRHPNYLQKQWRELLFWIASTQKTLFCCYNIPSFFQDRNV